MVLSFPQLRDPDLKAKSEKRFALSQSWEVEVTRSADAQTAEILNVDNAQTLLSLRKGRSSGYYRLLHELDPEVLAGLESMSIKFVCRTDNAAVFEWAAILEERADGHRAWVAKGTRVVVHPGASIAIEGAIDFKTGRWTQAFRPYLAFQFSTEPGNLDVTIVKVTTQGKRSRAAGSRLLEAARVLGDGQDTIVEPKDESSSVDDMGAHLSVHPSDVETLDVARELVTKIQKAVLGNWSRLSRATKAPLSELNVTTFTEALYAGMHSQRLNSLKREVSADITSLKALLYGVADLPSSNLSEKSFDYAIDSRAQILRTISKLASQIDTPYYPRLGAALSQLAEPVLLSEVWRTLHDIDLSRLGHLPRAVGPLVSVVMPAHNREHIIVDAVRSVVAQTYPTWELLVCDDGSDDGTTGVLAAFRDDRVRVLHHERRRGAAAARNTCLRQARGAFIAYLDSDNIWHPRFLELMLEELARCPGKMAAYASYFDVHLNDQGQALLKKADVRSFDLEDQLAVPFVDLNSFIHRRELGEVFGYFDERLVRRQDYDIIARYCWAREPHFVRHSLNIYQRIASLEQITRVQKGDETASALIGEKIESYYAQGLPVEFPPWLKKISVVSWDMSRNHFAKALCVAEALSEKLEVELISFRFFEAPIFEPLASVTPRVELKCFQGGDFPAFFDEFSRAVQAVSGDAIYAIKPRLPSLGLALMANYHTGKPIFLEVNDLETVVASPRASDRHAELPLEAVLDDLEKAKTPHSLIWSQVLDPCVAQLPVVYTHNVNLDIHYERRCLYMRNIKDEAIYDPSKMDRERLRSELGFASQDRVILFGGLVRKHKGVFELVELLNKLNDERYKLLVVASRETPDVRRLAGMEDERVTLLGPQPPQRMAELNCAADLVVLWQDPNVLAGHYQSPYKLSDALAMGPAIIASPTSDLASFAERDLLWVVPFGDFDGLVRTMDRIFANDEERNRRRERGRKLFLREFSYKAVPAALALGASRIDDPQRVYPVSIRFAKVFNDFHRTVSGEDA